MKLEKVFVYQEYPKSLDKLFELAYNLWWTWNHEAQGLFHRIDSELFREVDRNPIRLLYSLSRDRIESLAEDRGFLFELNRVWQKFSKYMEYVGGVRKENCDQYGFGCDESIAYFMMEVGVHESLPIYAGGLGILCGDFLKSSSDMGLPVVGVGLLYKYGYLSQRIDVEGRQVEEHVEFENHLAPMREARTEDGGFAYVNMSLLDQSLKVKLWQVDIGQSRLVLLDTDIDENPPHLRDITHELYAADRRKRIQQEFVLGLGGLKALETLGIEPRIFHLNEAHSAFVVVGRLEKLMKEEKLSFTEARAVIRASTVFTTHTPVRAGNESFEPDLVKKYVGPNVEALGIPYAEFERLGFLGEDQNSFWLPALSIRFSKFVNSVSLQHRGVTRKLWSNLFPDRAEIEVPIDHVTNGVHSSWISESFDYLFSRRIGPDYSRPSDGRGAWEKVLSIPNEDIWEAHLKNKKILVPFVRERVAADLAARGYPESKSLRLASLLNPQYLTVVFARRFASYKRPTLILKDKERLKSILSNPERPMQLIFAGRAHPADELGKEMIKEILDFAREYEVEDRVIFLQNYDLNMARHLVWGADVWLNTPVPNMEGSGTSGIKAAINGVLNLSVLEGWWKECFSGANGWAITAGQLYSVPELRDQAEAQQIYNLLEEEIAERYYGRNGAGIPEVWAHMMKESMYRVGYEFGMNRVLADYQRKLYVPAVKELEAVENDSYKLLKEAMIAEKEVLEHWDTFEIVGFSSNVDMRDHLTEGENITVECSVSVGQAPHEIFGVELFYLFGEGQDYRIIPMELVTREGAVAHYVCTFNVEGYGVQGMNVRIRPTNQIVAELHPELIKWRE